MTRWLIGMALVACGCPGKSQPTGPGNGSGSVENPGGYATTCDGLRPRLEDLYRAEGSVREPKRVDDYVADNTTMVLNDCAKAPDKVVACVNAASSIAEIEKKCLRPLDDEGTEGTELRK